MTQDEINKAEWENPDNWSLGSKWLRVYFSHRDTKTCVPKQTLDGFDSQLREFIWCRIAGWFSSRYSCNSFNMLYFDKLNH